MLFSSFSSSAPTNCRYLEDIENVMSLANVELLLVVVFDSVVFDDDVDDDDERSLLERDFTFIVAP